MMTGTCGQDARATAENQGYSDCCNDRIEYGDEAAQTRRRTACSHEVVETVTVQVAGFDGRWRTVTETQCSCCGEEIESMNAITNAINAAADGPTVAAYVPVAKAQEIVEFVGAERDGRGRWVFPDGFASWCLDEALRYALEVIVDVAS